MATIKSINTLTIIECCKLLNINPEDLQKKTINPNSLPENDVSNRLKNLIKKEEEVYRACNSKEEYEKYINSWSDGLHRAEAQATLQRLCTNKPIEEPSQLRIAEQDNRTSLTERNRHKYKYIYIICIYIIVMFIIMGLLLKSSEYLVTAFIMITTTLITVAILHNTIKDNDNQKRGN